MAAVTQEFSLEPHLCLFLVQAAEHHLVQLQMERLVVAAEQIKTVAKQVPQQLQVAVEQVLLVVLVQPVTQAAQQLDRYRVMVLTCKAEHRVTKLILKAAAAAVVVTTAAAEVHIKPQAAVQKTVVVAAVRAILI